MIGGRGIGAAPIAADRRVVSGGGGLVQLTASARAAAFLSPVLSGASPVATARHSLRTNGAADTASIAARAAASLRSSPQPAASDIAGRASAASRNSAMHAADRISARVAATARVSPRSAGSALSGIAAAAARGPSSPVAGGIFGRARAAMRSTPSLSVPVALRALARAGASASGLVITGTLVVLVGRAAGGARAMVGSWASSLTATAHGVPTARVTASSGLVGRGFAAARTSAKLVGASLSASARARSSGGVRLIGASLSVVARAVARLTGVLGLLRPASTFKPDPGRTIGTGVTRQSTLSSTKRDWTV